MRPRLVLEKERVQKMIDENLPFAEIARRLGVARDTAREFIRKNWPEYKGNQNRPGIKHYNQRIPILERLKSGSHVANGDVRKRLIEEGYKKAICECCGLSEWMGKPIPLELHHADFNHWNNSLENLQILCSNCHMQAHNYNNTSTACDGMVDMHHLE